MWEHRAVSHKQFKESGRITPTETYVQLMDKVEDSVKEAQKMPFDHEEFLKYIPTHILGSQFTKQMIQREILELDTSATRPPEIVEHQPLFGINMD